MPMLASETSSRPGTVGGLAGFSTKARITRAASTAITPSALASLRGTSMQPTVQGRPGIGFSNALLPAGNARKSPPSSS